MRLLSHLHTQVLPRWVLPQWVLPQWVLPGLLVAGCATATPPPAPAAPQAAAVRVRLPGVVVQAEPDPLTQLEIYDAEELFHHARDMNRNGRQADAETVYRRLLEYFPDSALAEPARFNLALLYEARERFDLAAGAYEQLATQEPPPGAERRRTWLDAHFRLAVCAGKLQEWWWAVGVFDQVLAQDWLEDQDRLEALLGRGISLQEAGDPASAEVAFSAVLRFAREAERRGPLLDRTMVAEAAFRMGEISAERYQAVVLEFPVELLQERLEAKCGELLAAQQRYLRAIRNGDAHTVAAAGYKIGQLYETLYDTILALEAPASLTPEQVELYQLEVRKRVHVLVEKALTIYEKALLVGRSAPTAEDWNLRLERAIERLRQIYLQPELAALRR